jgi:hypothetical protein
VQRPQEALAIGAVLRRDIDVDPSDSGNAAPVSARDSPALVELRVTRATLPRDGSTVSKDGQSEPRML